MPRPNLGLMEAVWTIYVFKAVRIAFCSYKHVPTASVATARAEAIAPKLGAA
jgi:hypothetical protein